MTDKQEKCVWCGKTYEEHRDSPLPSGAVPKMGCTGLKAYFYSKKESTPTTPQSSISGDITNNVPKSGEIPTTPSQWEEEFDKQSFCFTDDYDNTRKLHTNYDTTSEVKAFIHQTLQHERQRWVAELEGKKKTIGVTALAEVALKKEWRDKYTLQDIRNITKGFNQGLQTAIDTIEENTNLLKE